jgi:hypothetical protein
MKTIAVIMILLALGWAECMARAEERMPVIGSAKFSVADEPTISFSDANAASAGHSYINLADESDRRRPAEQKSTMIEIE